MKNSNQFLLQNLERPDRMIDVVLDTDTFNEVDDQFALSYLLRSNDKLNTQAVYAAPFLNEKSDSPRDGMEKSYNEILNIISLCGRKDLADSVFKGSETYLENETTPVKSPAAIDLANRAASYTPESPLYVVALGAITNVVSALLINPDIIDKIVIVWLGGNAMHVPNYPEFNMVQDIAAARVVFNSTAPLVQLPCFGVVTHLTTTEPELRHHLKGKGSLSDYLYTITCNEASGYCWSRVIWDVSAVAWLLSEKFMQDKIIHAPIPSYDNGYIINEERHFMRYVYYVNRDAIFEDLFKKLSAY